MDINKRNYDAEIAERMLDILDYLKGNVTITNHQVEEIKKKIVSLVESAYQCGFNECINAVGSLK